MSVDSIIGRLIESHEAMRSQGINLNASENRLSERALRALASDLAGRSHHRFYGGTAAARRIIEETEELARRLFGTRFALVTPPSGRICDLAVILTFTAPWDQVALLSSAQGGLQLGLEKVNRRRVSFVLNESATTIDVGHALRKIQEEKVGVVMLGASFFPFPHPVREISEGMRKLGEGGICVYEGSQVLGLIACGQFQDPLGEGADLLVGSTHMSFFGPQGGIILTNVPEYAVALRKMVDVELTGPALVDNPHLNRIAALGIALEEMLNDTGYGRRVIDNAKILARRLDEFGVPVRFREHGYTSSHQVILDLDASSASKLSMWLEEIGIFIDAMGRMGTAEITRMGMGPRDMEELAKIIAETYHNGPREQNKSRVWELALAI